VARLRTLFFGTGDIGLPSLRALAGNAAIDLLGVVTGQDRPAGRGLQLQPGPIAQFAREQGLPLWQPEKLRDPELEESWRKLTPDLLVVMAYGKILPPWVLQLPRIAPWNLHASLLPRHRGASPIHAAILAGDKSTGITVMLIGEGLDTGDILCKEEIPISDADTAGSLHDRLATVAPIALQKALDQLASGTLQATPQNNDEATYAGKISKKDGAIDWTLPADEILRRIRAFTPWPGATTVLPVKEGGVVLKIGGAAGVEDAVQMPAGKFLVGDGGRLFVGTGKGVIELLAVQIPGKKMLPTEDFLRGFHSTLD
jgi:methionyl-tRNA formyltransferase